MSLPSKLTSYFFSGRPVLASVDPLGACAKEIIKTNGAGEIVPAGRPIQLADAIRRLKEDSIQLNDMGIKGKQYSMVNLSRDTAMARLQEIVNQFA
jgi:hypothetical protein